jgi:hypothetical protein
MMDSQKAHQSGCARGVHPGVGVEPGGLGSPGGGSRHRRDRQPVKWLEETFTRSVYLMDSQKVHLAGCTRSGHPGTGKMSLSHSLNHSNSDLTQLGLSLCQ